MEFEGFNKLVQERYRQILSGSSALFIVDLSKQELWDAYLESFAPEDNVLVKERREFDCNCCKSFIGRYGGLIGITNMGIMTLWDFVLPTDEAGHNKFEASRKALDDMVFNAPIREPFLTQESRLGTSRSFDNDREKFWNHFSLTVPSDMTLPETADMPKMINEARVDFQLLKRGFEEFTTESVQEVMSLIDADNLYRGDTWRQALSDFFVPMTIYRGAESDREQELFLWMKSLKLSPQVCRIRNSSIGQLLIDLSGGKSLEDSVRSYERITAPENYRRPKGIFSERQREMAVAKLQEKGLDQSLTRRHATLDEIEIANVLFIDRDATTQFSDSPLDLLTSQATVKKTNYKNAPEVGVSDFVDEILPSVSKVEILFRSNMRNNLASILTAENEDAPGLFQWDNPYSWSYIANNTDAMRQRVEMAGGKVDGILRCSVQWNDDPRNPNHNDYDLWAIEPSGTKIWYNMERNKGTKGYLDVDAFRHTPNSAQASKPAVENIAWPDLKVMHEGTYTFIVHNYAHRGGRDGFKAQIEYGGEIWEFEYRHNLGSKEQVQIAKINFSKANGVTFIESMDSTLTTQSVWGLKINSFVPVSAIMFSPNKWGRGSAGAGHIFYTIQDCLADVPLNGFYNEFLSGDLREYRQVLEALSGLTRVQPAEDQLSGFGFINTRRNNSVVRVSDPDGKKRVFNVQY